MSNKYLDYFDDDELAASVWYTKYSKEGTVSPVDLHNKMTKDFFTIYKQNEKFHKKDLFSLSEFGRKFFTSLRENEEQSSLNNLFNLFKEFRHIIPQGSVMSGITSKSPVSLSNCFVIDSAVDSYAGIFKTDQEQAQLMKRRGGVGHDLSLLRPYTTPVDNAAESSTGAVSFMHRFSATTREVAMDGRRGALMLSIDINHPDVEEFALSKTDLTKVTGANISIKLNREFMEAVTNDSDYLLRFPTNTSSKISQDSLEEMEYGVLYQMTPDDPFGRKYVKRVRAKDLWETIIKQARDTAEPGLMFWDNVLDLSPDGVYPEYTPITSNPCGEQFLQAEDSCRLIAQNLFSIVKNPFTDKAEIDFQLLYEISYQALWISDLLVDLEVQYIDKIIKKIESDPEDESIKATELNLWKNIRKTAVQGRRTGVGITALGDMLAALGLKYDSEEAYKIIEQVMHTKMKAELDCSIDLAILLNPFEGWDFNSEYSITADNYYKGKNSFYENLRNNFPIQFRKMKIFGRRNVSFSTVAPTGSVSILTRTTSGCEPLFKTYYVRRKKINPNEPNVRVDFIDDLGDKWQEFNIIHPKLEDWLVLNKGISREDIINLSKEHLNTLISDSPWIGSTAENIDWIQRVNIQALLQKYTSNAISSTINLPENTTEKEVESIYLASWKAGLKGITVYREGSRSGVMVEDKADSVKVAERPEQIDCKVIRFKNEKKNWVAFVGLVNGRPYEIFTGINELDAFPIPTYVEEGTIIKVSTPEGSRYDFRYKDSYDYVNTLGGLNRIFKKEFWNYARLTSAILRENVEIQDVIKILSKLEFSDKSMNTWQAGIIRALSPFIKDGTVSKETCSECGQDSLIYQEGCLTCQNCGFSKCG